MRNQGMYIINYKVCSFRLIILLLCVSSCFSQGVLDIPWYSPLELLEGASPEQVQVVENFNAEIKLASEAPDRNSEIEHLQKALEYRPDDPDNIRIEFEIAIAMSQHWDPENPQPMRREESVEYYKRILNNYNHMDYYSIDGINSSSCRQFIIPQASIHLAGLQRGLYGDNESARKTLKISMQCMVQTYEKRKYDWLNANQPKDVKLEGRFGGPVERAKWESRMSMWETRKKKAEAGDVFSKLEMEIAKAAVRQYGLTFGTRQKAMDVALAMGEIIRDYPGTPMAKIAADHIEKAKEMSLEEINKEVLLPPSIYGEENIKGAMDTQDISENIEDIIVEVFIPKIDKQLKEGKPFVFSFVDRKLVNCSAKPDSESAYKALRNLGKGDIAWDGSLITVRRAKALNIKEEYSRSLQYLHGRWCDRNILPENVSLPYSLLVVTNEDIDFLITIKNIETEGVTISYRRLSSEEVKLFLPDQNVEM
ncbi:MAG: hypothetical protein JXA96_06445 [Sedimentisphaerales bacterium]|nr:hypothetical protein [Sedimentisphaerales bacterium]